MKYNKNNEVINSIVKLLSGSLIAQVIVFITMPIITRLYTPEDIGAQGVFISVVGILAIFFTLNYHQAIAITVKKYEKFYISLICFTISTLLFFLSIITLYILDFFCWNITFFSNTKYFIIIGGFLTSIVLLLEQFCYKEKLFAIQSKSQVYYSLSGQSLKICLGLLSSSSIYLIVSILISYVIKIVYIGNFFVMKLNFLSKYKLNILNVRAVARKYKSFPLYRLPQTLLTMFSLNVPVYFLTSNYGLVNTGYYALAMSVLGLPLTLFGNSVTNVLYPKVTELYISSKEVAVNYILKSIRLIALILILPFSLFYFISEFLFEFIFGEGWKVAGVFSSYLVIQFYMVVVARPAIVYITVSNKNKEYFYYEIITFFLKLLLVASSYYLNFNVHKFIVLYSSLTALCYFLVLIYIVNLKAGNSHEQ